MPSAGTFALFAIAALTLLVIPGPAVLYVVSRSVEGGRRAGLVSVLGLHAGTLVHIAAAAAGISSLVLASATAFDVLRYAGAAYLVFLGVRRLLARTPAEVVDESPPSARRLFGQGIVVNVLNPKTALFMFAFLPQFVAVDRGHVWLQVVLLGVTFLLLGLVTDSAWAVAAGRAAGWLRRSRAFRRAERWVSGGMLVGLGVAAAAAGGRRSGG